MPSQTACAWERADAACDGEKSVFVVTPQRCGTARGLWLFHATLCVGLLFAAIVTLAMGLWPLAVFFGLDALVLIGALQIHRLSQQRRREEIAVTPAEVVVRRFAFCGPTREMRMRALGLGLTRHEDPNYGCLQLMLNSWRRETEIGRGLSPAERSCFADALTQALKAADIPVAVDVRPPRSPLSARAARR